MKLSIAELKNIVAAYVAANKIGQGFAASVNNTAGLLDQIARTYTLDGMFEDKLPELDGDNLGLAKTLQEYYANLILPADKDSTGSATLAPADLTYMPPSYHYDLGNKVFKDTRRYNDVERACANEADYVSLIDLITKRLWDSFALFKFNAKKELLSKYAAACATAMGSTTTFAGSTAYSVGAYLRDGTNAPITYGVVVKAIPASGGPASWALAISGGYIVTLDLVTAIASPADTSTGEAFIKEVKKYAKKAQFVSEGNSLNGNTVGASEGMLLVIKSSITPSIEVDTMAGVFNKEFATFGVETKEVDDFGSDATGVYAMLIDRRGCKLHNSYQAVRTQENADGDFINYVLHSDNTAAFSKNTFVHVFKTA